MHGFDSKWRDVSSVIMGISHAGFSPLGNGDPTMWREQVLIDETATWKQFVLKTGRHE